MEFVGVGIVCNLEDVKFRLAMSLETDYRRFSVGGQIDLWESAGAPGLLAGLRRLLRWPGLFDGLYFAG